MSKILNLILYSDDVYFDMMKTALSRYLEHKGIEHYFYSYDENMTEEYVIERNHLRLKGKESLVPGVLDKTLKALKIFQDHEYDYILRTNVSTIIDFDELYKHLHNAEDYSGPMHHRMYVGTDPECAYGMTPEKHAKYCNYSWVSGICVLLSKKAVKMLVSDAEIVMSPEVIDDSALGIYFHERQHLAVRTTLCDWSKVLTGALAKTDGVMVYRNKSDNRLTDVCRMRTIMKGLM